MTEALAATLEAAPDAATVLAQRWFGKSPAAPLGVSTQLRASAGERIDLELRFGQTSRPELRIWFEAKVDAPPTRAQAVRYARLLRERSGDSRLCWLLPVGVAVSGGSPDGVEERTWQELASVLDDWLNGLAESERKRFGPGLVQEFIRHLEEERLASTQPLDLVDAQAINRHETAEARLREVLRQAAAVIRVVRQRVHGPPNPSPRNFWEHVTPGAPWPAGSYYEWKCSRDDIRADPVGEWVIGAGVSWERGTEPRESEFQEWFARRWREGFELGAVRAMVYLFRYLKVEHVASAPTVPGQANMIATHALETWALLDNDPLAGFERAAHSSDS